MEIRLGAIRTINGVAHIEHHDQLTSSEFEVFRGHIDEIKHVKNNRSLRRIVQLNCDSFFRYYEQMINEFKANPLSFETINKKRGEEYVVNINRHLLNYLSTVRTLLDHSDKFISSRFGSGSQQQKDFNRFLANIYDGNFAYRFLYKLRNYAQHCVLPLENISFNAKTQEDGSVIGSIELYFSPKELLEKYDGWGTVKNDLAKMDQNFAVQPLLIEVEKCINQIWMFVDVLNSDNIRRSAQYIKDKTAKINAPDVELCIFYDIRKLDDEKNTFSLLGIPMEIINQLNLG